MFCRLVHPLLPVLLVGAGLGCTPSSGGGGEGSGGTGAGGSGGQAGGRPPQAGAPASPGGAGGSTGGGGSGGGNAGAPAGGGGAGGGGAGGGSTPRPQDAGGRPRDGGRGPDAALPSVDGGGVGPTAPAPPEFKTPGIVVYWGQNGVGSRIVDPTKHEKPLADTCRDNPHYEMIVIGFIIDFFSPENVDRTPRTNFSKHCNSMNAYDENHRRLYKCDEIGRGVNECQRMGKKVLLSLGGANGSYGFNNDDEARMFAQTTWDLFLGGKSNFRPFSTAVLDGIDLDIESSRTLGYSTYVTRLRELMKADPTGRRYYVTAAPQCPFPDAALGPAPGKALGDVPRLFDFLFVQFYNNFCAGFNPDFFMMSYNRWAGVGPKVMVGLPARTDAGGGHVARGALPALLNRVKGTPAFGGVMLWDASYDQNSVEGGTTYGQFVKSQLP
jgi:chitinase